MMTTTGLFNNKDQAEGALNIYKKDDDLFGDLSPWERLIERSMEANVARCSSFTMKATTFRNSRQNYLAELEPDAYLLASATLKLPANFQKSVIQPIQAMGRGGRRSRALRRTQGRGRPKASPRPSVHHHGCEQRQGGGGRAGEEGHPVRRDNRRHGTLPRRSDRADGSPRRGNRRPRDLSFKPKAIYVCKTNIADDGEKDDASKPFQHRNAPPIRIWRYLVEEKGIAPRDIAIYANLTFVEGNKPDEVNLFSKGENDFDDFTAGNYQHIIFNLSLQEGWDDPACYLAYIDKSMGSSIQVEQIIGRVLRQYGAKHYDNPLFNSAHFFFVWISRAYSPTPLRR